MLQLKNMTSSSSSFLFIRFTSRTKNSSSLVGCAHRTSCDRFLIGHSGYTIAQIDHVNCAIHVSLNCALMSGIQTVTSHLLKNHSSGNLKKTLRRKNEISTCRKNDYQDKMRFLKCLERPLEVYDINKIKQSYNHK